MDEDAADKPWRPDCICGSDPEFFRHRSDCPLRYWHEAVTLERENAELRAKVRDLELRLSGNGSESV